MNPSQNPSALRSKSEITSALFELMKKYRFSDITVKQIILEYKVSRKTFYRNFTSKTDVLLAHIEKIILDYVDDLTKLTLNSQDTPGTSLTPEQILPIIFAKCLENRELLMYLHKNDLMYLLLEQINSVITTIHHKLVPVDNYLFTGISHYQSEYIINFNVGAVWNVLCKWIENDMRDDPDEIIRTIDIFLTRIVDK